jgi:hypothetical protein
MSKLPIAERVPMVTIPSKQVTVSTSDSDRNPRSPTVRARSQASPRLTMSMSLVAAMMP